MKYIIGLIIIMAWIYGMYYIAYTYDSVWYHILYIAVTIFIHRFAIANYKTSPS